MCPLMDDGRVAAGKGSAVASAVEAAAGMVVGDGGVRDGGVTALGRGAVGEVSGLGVSVGANAAWLFARKRVRGELEAWLMVDGWGVELMGCMPEEGDVMGLADGVPARTVDKECSIVATVVGC